MKKLKNVGLMVLAVAAIVSSCKKKEEVKDTEAPVITLKGGNPDTISLNAGYTDPGATATDNTGGDISSKITVSGLASLNKDSVGIYTITYSVSDEAGNSASATRIVKVKNDAEGLEGIFSAETTIPNPSNNIIKYTDTVSASKAVNNQLWVTTFGSRANGKAFITVTSATTLAFTTQEIVCGVPPASYKFETVSTPSTKAENDSTFTVNYKETLSGTSKLAKTVYTR